MAEDKKIDDAIEKTNLDGTEVFPSSSSSLDRKISVDSIATYTKEEIAGEDSITSLDSNNNFLIGIGSSLYTLTWTRLKSLIANTISAITNIVTLANPALETVSGVPTLQNGANAEFKAYIENHEARLDAIVTAYGQISYDEALITTTETAVPFTITTPSSNTDVFDFDDTNYYAIYYLNAIYSISSTMTYSNSSTSTAHTLTINAYTVEDSVETLINTITISIPKSTTEKLRIADYFETVTDAPRVGLLKFVSTSDTDVTLNSYSLKFDAGNVEGYDTDVNVKASSTDDVSGYLTDKLTVGDYLTSTLENEGGDENLLLALDADFVTNIEANIDHRENLASAEAIATKFNGSVSLCKSNFTFNVTGTIDWSIDIKVGEMITANQDATTASQLSFDVDGNGEFYVYFTSTLFYAVMRDSNNAVSYFVFARSEAYIPIAEEDVLTITVGDNGSGNVDVLMYLNGVDMTTLSTSEATGSSSNADSSLCEGDYTIYLGSTFGAQWYYTGALYYFTLTSSSVVISDLQDIYSGVDEDGNTYTITNLYKERDITYPHPASAVYIETLEDISIEEGIGKGEILTKSYLPTANQTRLLSSNVTIESGARGIYNLNGNTLYIKLYDTEGDTYIIGDDVIEFLKGMYNGRVVISCEDDLVPTTAGSSQGIIVSLSSTGWYNLMNLNVNIEFIGIKFTITSAATQYTFFEAKGSNSINTNYCCFNFANITADAIVFNISGNKVVSVNDCFIGSATYNTTFVNADDSLKGGMVEVMGAIYETTQFTYAVSGLAGYIGSDNTAFETNVTNNALQIASRVSTTASSLDFSSSTSQTVTLTGVTVSGYAVSVSPQAALDSGNTYYAYISAADTITIVLNSTQTTAVTFSVVATKL